MKNLLTIASVGVLVISSTSCKKENDHSNGFPLSYSPMTIGSYWVYDYYNVMRKDGSSSPIGRSDSIVVTSDTIIKGRKYFVLREVAHNPKHVYKILRDSSGYLVDEKSTIHFARNNFKDTLAIHYYGRATSISIAYQMQKTKEKITVPAGTFECLNYTGTFAQDDGIPWPRVDNNYYAPGVGKLTDNMFFTGSSNYRQRRLVRYHIAN